MSLSQKLLSLIEESPLPISTPDLIDMAASDLPHARSRVWDILQELAYEGLVRKSVGPNRNYGARGHTKTITYWSRP